MNHYFIKKKLLGSESENKGSSDCERQTCTCEQNRNWDQTRQTKIREKLMYELNSMPMGHYLHPLKNQSRRRRAVTNKSDLSDQTYIAFSPISDPKIRKSWIFGKFHHFFFR